MKHRPWRHEWRSVPKVKGSPSGNATDLLGYVAEFTWECRTCGTSDPKTVCEEVLVDRIHAF